MSEQRYPLASANGDTSVPSAPRFPDVEAAVLRYWDADGTFQASIDARPALGPDGTSNEHVFYDGPPFANGLPHYGHLLTGYVKDLVPRYRTMRGERVERRFGWDTHGLPAETEAERQLGIAGRQAIEDHGVAEFNAFCRSSVLRYTGEWQEYVTRQARWVDFEHDYKTLDLDYMESVMWAFKALHDKGLVYEGFRVLPYSWALETPLSNTETRMDDVYRDRQDPALTVGFPLLAPDGAAASEGDPLTGALVTVWTTTPWTLPSNLAVAVHPDLDYVVVAGPLPDDAPEGAPAPRFVLAEVRLGHYARELGEAPEVLARVKGSDLAGRRYTPPFRYFAGAENAHRVLTAEFVTTEDGTGIVHLAPGFGEDDMAVCQAAGIATVVPIDSRARFTAEVPDYEGQQVFDANPVIAKDIRAGLPSGAVLLRHESYLHSYPHCYRTSTPLIYKAVSSWFVEVTAIRDRMVELNREITWVPGHVKDGSFGKWLEGARDWTISRNRFWGSPIPVWQSDDPRYPRTDVYGSLDEIERDFGVRPTDLHRPVVDELTRPNPDDPRPEGERSTMRRVSEVLDCWFESGAMPFAQVHYPFENVEWFESHNPGDFIVEYIGQTRGWFYTLHVLATALFDRPAFRTAVSHGIVLGDDGRKMSKSLRNYPDVSEVFARDGADAMRWFLMSSPILRGGNLVTTEAGIREGVRQVMLPLWNAWSFLALYAGSAGGDAGGSDGAGGGVVGCWRTDSTHELDRYVLAKLHDLVVDVQTQLDELDVAGACESVRVFLDALTNWYVRRSRARFWAEDRDAIDTLHTVLEVVCRVAAPMLPLTAEEVWRGLTGGRSVHLTDWPDAADLPGGAGDTASRELVGAMDAVRTACSAALGLRKAHGLRVRQPLAELTVVTAGAAALEGLRGLVADEVNVKQVVLLDVEGASEADFGLERKLTVNARAAGPRLGKGVQAVIKAARSGDWSVESATDDRGEPDGEVVVAGGVALLEGEYELTTVVAQAGPGSGGDGGERVTATLPGGGFVVLTTTITEELAAEGWARDVVRQVQDARKAAGLHVSDRIVLDLAVPAAQAAWAQAHRELVARETLATELRLTGATGADVEVTVTRA